MDNKFDIKSYLKSRLPLILLSGLIATILKILTHSAN